MWKMIYECEFGFQVRKQRKQRLILKLNHEYRSTNYQEKKQKKKKSKANNLLKQAIVTKYQTNTLKFISQTS